MIIVDIFVYKIFWKEKNTIAGFIDDNIYASEDSHAKSKLKKKT